MVFTMLSSIPNSPKDKDPQLHTDQLTHEQPNEDAPEDTEKQKDTDIDKVTGSSTSRSNLVLEIARSDTNEDETPKRPPRRPKSERKNKDTAATKDTNITTTSLKPNLNKTDSYFQKDSNTVGQSPASSAKVPTSQDMECAIAQLPHAADDKKTVNEKTNALNTSATESHRSDLTNEKCATAIQSSQSVSANTDIATGSVGVALSPTGSVDVALRSTASGPQQNNLESEVSVEQTSHQRENIEMLKPATRMKTVSKAFVPSQHKGSVPSRPQATEYPDHLNPFASPKTTKKRQAPLPPSTSVRDNYPKELNPFADE